MTEFFKDGSALELLNAAQKKPAPAFADMVTKEELSAAIKANGGFMAFVAKSLAVPLRTLEYLVSQKFPELQDVIFEQRALYTDFAESKLLEKVKGGHFEALKFWLKCQGKERGWVERSEDKETLDAPLQINIINATGVTVNTSKQEVIKEVEVAAETITN